MSTQFDMVPHSESHSNTSSPLKKKSMEIMKGKKSQILKLSLIAALLFITPLLSSSLRTTYLYFIINLLIIALGAEAGLLSFFSNPPSAPVSAKPLVSTPPPPPPPDHKESSSLSIQTDTNTTTTTTTYHHHHSETKRKAVEKSASEKIVGAGKLSKVRKSPSTPSIFFIGGSETEPEEAAVAAVEVEEEDGISGQELFTKAETFIGNFYKQLKMQREESWKKLHEFYHRAF